MTANSPSSHFTRVFTSLVKSKLLNKSINLLRREVVYACEQYIMQKLSNSENMEQLRKAQIVQAINVKAGALVYQSTKLGPELGERSRKIVAHYIWNRKTADFMIEVPLEIKSNAEGIISDLEKFRDSELAQTVRKRVSQDILAGKASNLHKLVEGTSIHNSKHLRDEECVLESDEAHSQNTSSLSLVLTDSSLFNGKQISAIETLRDKGKQEAETKLSGSSKQAS